MKALRNFGGVPRSAGPAVPFAYADSRRPTTPRRRSTARAPDLATSALITELSLDGVLQRVVQVAAEVIGAHYAAIGVLAPDGRVLESFTTHGISDEQRALHRSAAARATASWAW